MNLAQKIFRSFRLGRINVNKEARRQKRLRSSLERKLLKNLQNLLRKHIRMDANDIETDIYNSSESRRRKAEEGLILLRNHINQVYVTVFEDNQNRYQDLQKQLEFNVFGRNIDIDDLAKAYIADRQLVLSGIFNGISNQIDRIIAQAFQEEGLSQTQIADSIRSKAPQISATRAAMITRTETHSAVGHAQHAYHEVVKDVVGVNMQKRWVSTADARTRTAHVLANGQIVDFDEDFLVGGSRMRFVGDPRGGARNVINCRCTIVYVNIEDVENMEE